MNLKHIFYQSFRKRYHLTDDIISDLIRAEYEGERLTDEEIVTFHWVY